MRGRAYFRGTGGPLSNDLRKAFDELEGSDTWLKLEGGDLSYPILVRLGVVSDGSLAVTALIAGAFGEPGPITFRSLRDIRIGDILDTVPKPKNPNNMTVAELAGALVRKTSPRVRGSKKKPGPALSDDHFREVAERYRVALVTDPRAPVVAVAAQYPHTPVETVRRWVRVARQRGFLGQAQSGKAGELPSTVGTRTRKPTKRKET
jgi:hypothetical protein